MAGAIQSPNSYLDFAGLGRLRGQARADRGAAVRETARQFEAMFIQDMIKAMREASVKSDLVESPAMETYQGMFDKEISVQMARRGVLGIGDMLARQMNAAAPPAASAEPMALPQVGGAHSGPGMPLVRERPSLPLTRPAPEFNLQRPGTEGLPLQPSSGVDAGDAAGQSAK